MVKGIICRMAVVSAFTTATLFAQGNTNNAVEGTLLLNKRTHKLSQAVAYETTIDDEEATVVVAGTQAMTAEILKAARAAEKEGKDPELKRPYLRLVFKKTGELKHWGAADNNSALGRSTGDGTTGELVTRDGRAVGKASKPNDPEALFPSSFDIKFDVALLKAGESLPESTAKKGGPAANVKPTVTGLFRGNDKEAKLAYVSARWSEPFSGKTGITLVFTEKDHSKEKKPDTGAMFGRFGSALIISLHEEDGQIYGCQVVHSAHQKQGFTSIGRIEATEFNYADGKVEGGLTTHGEADTFGEKWEVDLKFVAPLGEIPKEFQVAKEPEKPAKSATADDDDKDDDDDDEEPAGQPAAPGLSVKELPLTKDATGVEYKEMVEHVLFKSPSDVKKVCAELAASLKAQGWTVDGRDMVNPQSSIMRRKRGNASLTIFVKPEGGGSDVKIFTEGLAW